MPTSLVSLQQGKVKKISEKPMKSVIIEGENLHISYLLNDLKNFNKILRKDVAYDGIKIQEKAGLHGLSRPHFCKTTGEGGCVKLRVKRNPAIICIIKEQ